MAEADNLTELVSRLRDYVTEYEGRPGLCEALTEAADAIEQHKAALSGARTALRTYQPDYADAGYMTALEDIDAAIALAGARGVS